VGQCRSFACELVRDADILPQAGRRPLHCWKQDTAEGVGAPGLARNDVAAMGNEVGIWVGQLRSRVLSSTSPTGPPPSPARRRATNVVLFIYRTVALFCPTRVG